MYPINLNASSLTWQGMGFAEPPAENGALVERVSITERFLKAFPLDEIRARLKEQANNGFDLEPILGIFNEAIAHERAGCFGYHATTMKHWVLNEIIKQILRVKGDPYFLRAPNACYSEFQNTAAFLSKFSARKLSIEEMRRFIGLFLLKPIGMTNLAYDDAKAMQIYGALLSYSERSSELTKEEAEKVLVEFVGEKSCAFEKWLEAPIRDEYEEEQTGEEHQFLIEILYPLNDVWETQQKFLVSLNISLFGNFGLSSESTIHVFARGRSVDLAADENIDNAAMEFLSAHGFPKEMAKEIFEEAHAILNLNQGLLLQFFDDPTYSHLDQFTYFCTNFGKPFPESPSNFLSHFDPLKRIERVEESIIGSFTLHPQLRLLITEEILHPSSWLEIKQYDGVPAERKEAVRTLISNKLAEFFRQSKEVAGGYLGSPQ